MRPSESQQIREVAVDDIALATLPQDDLIRLFADAGIPVVRRGWTGELGVTRGTLSLHPGSVAGTTVFRWVV